MLEEILLKEKKKKKTGRNVNIYINMCELNFELVHMKTITTLAAGLL